MSVSKVFVIGIDGATWFLFDRLLERGVMPHLKNLVANFFFFHSTGIHHPAGDCAGLVLVYYRQKSR